MNDIILANIIYTAFLAFISTIVFFFQGKKYYKNYGHKPIWKGTSILGFLAVPILFASVLAIGVENFYLNLALLGTLYLAALIYTLTKPCPSEIPGFLESSVYGFAGGFWAWAGFKLGVNNVSTGLQLTQEPRKNLVTVHQTTSLSEELYNLSKLRDSGALSVTEFEKAKDTVLKKSA
jgi:hypothetical protein